MAFNIISSEKLRGKIYSVKWKLLAVKCSRTACVNKLPLVQSVTCAVNIPLTGKARWKCTVQIPCCDFHSLT